MDRAYDTSVSRRQWQIGLFAFALTLIVGAALALALLAGAANSPRAAMLIDTLSFSDLMPPPDEVGEGVRLYRLPIYDFRPPFTIEMEARSIGESGSAWGLWLHVRALQADSRRFAALIDKQGYMLSASGDLSVEHVEFMHIRPDTNRLSVHLSSDNQITFRVNDEIFRAYDFPTAVIGESGVALYGVPQLADDTIKIYTG